MQMPYWHNVVDETHNGLPEMTSKPLIGITANRTKGEVSLSEAYVNAVANAGGVPVVLPCVEDNRTIISMIESVDAIILSGGGDHNPLLLGEEPMPLLSSIDSRHDIFELSLAHLAYQRQLPILGICRGIQTLTIALGGHVAQDITGKIKHSQHAPKEDLTHSVKILTKSILQNLYKAEKIGVNSFHHQAVDRCPLSLKPTAFATDGIIEAVESTENKPVLGVQWHPEHLGKHSESLFKWLVQEAELHHRAKLFHKNNLTLDSHCDTPMHFSQGADFARRDEKLLVDIHKMREGKLDTVIMAAYLPQPAQGEDFRCPNTGKIIDPEIYANAVFNNIIEAVKRCDTVVALAKSPNELYQNKRQGRSSVMLSIENGLALKEDIDAVKRFAKRGVVYITLCHNGSNALCDSAKGEAIHHGISALGEKMIRQMNLCGVMVDMSHASEKSFYDAIDISKVPIICSHSSSRSLCNHPRNLSDEQMKALALKGGVAQMTLYKGFLNVKGDADVSDFLSHIDHAINVMGVEYVGIGSDFDGDGGVKGFANASEAISFTKHLMRKRYNEEDIKGLWGGNFLRVMDIVQKTRG